MTVRLVMALSLFILTPCRAFADAVYFGEASDANVYVFEDFFGRSSDVQGKIVAGGNVDIMNYSVGLLNDASETNLYAGGDLVLNGGDINGLATVKGTSTINSAKVPQGSNESYSFNREVLSDLSRELYTNSSGSYFNRWGALVLQDEHPNGTLNVNVEQSDFESVWGIFAEANVDDRVIVNVSGNHVTFNYADWLMKESEYRFNINAANVLYNFYEAETLDIYGSVYGSILAPSADINANNGVIEGQIFANSFYGQSQVNKSLFNADDMAVTVPDEEQNIEDGTTDVTSSPVSSITLLFLGLLMYFRKSNSVRISAT